tara:strand:- start:235 stop:483 length:249 start_codon:yes stop_codon:yes gene_type:complete
MTIHKTKEELEALGAIVIPGTITNNDNILEHILYHNTPKYRKISPCKECGNEVGVLLPNGFTSLAECSICKHLCDVKTHNNV